MKQLIKILSFFFVLALLGACKATDPDNLTIMRDEDIYTNLSRIRQVLTNIYAGLPNGYSNIGKSWLAAACDEAEEVNDMEAIQNFNLGNISPYSNPDDIWNSSYESIRNVQIFLASTDTITWNNYKYSNPTEYANRIRLTAQYRAEARFLNAFFYFELIKRYGGVPIADTVINKDEAGWINRYPRKSFAECVDYIVDNCDTAAKYLPRTMDTGDWGRATKGAAMALKARVLLYAASDLYNRSGNDNPLLGYTAGDRKGRWEKAAKACKDLIDLAQYNFATTYQTLFNLGSTQSSEVIFERRYGEGNDFEQENTPVGFNLGQTGTCPSGNLVDAFEQLDNGTFSWDNPTHAANPYNRRDPRLAKIVTLNNSSFGKARSTVELWYGGINGKPRDRASKTGYYLRKYINENLDLVLGEVSKKQWVFFRLTEIYLDYAEAMNEAFGPESTGGGSLSVTALQAVNSVRTRAAVGMPGIATGVNQTELRSRIRNERRVELAFEGHRYWDARRWLIGDKAIGGNITGVNIVKNENGSFTYTPVVIETRYWSDRLYYYPIPQSEVNKSGGVIVQNPGW